MQVKILSERGRALFYHSLVKTDKLVYPPSATIIIPRIAQTFHQIAWAI